MSRLNRSEVQAHKLQNMLRSIAYLSGMGLMLGTIGFLMFGATGLIWGLAFWAVSSLFMPHVSRRFILEWMGARPLEPWEAPRLYQLVDELAQEAQLPTTPVLYLARGAQPNAFAMGRAEESFIGVTSGLLHQLDLRQMRGVLAHEVAHIKNGDLWVMSLAEGMTRLVSFLSFFGVIGLLLMGPFLLVSGQPFPLLIFALMLVAPNAMRLMLYALSRTREFEADRQAAILTNDPLGLASALQRIEQGSQPWWEKLFWTPREYRESQEPDPLRTHPQTEERVERLQAFARKQSRRAPAQAAEVIIPEVIPPQRRKKREPSVEEVFGAWPFSWDTDERQPRHRRRVRVVVPTYQGPRYPR